MTPVERLLIQDCCRSLMTEYCIHLDARDEDRFMALFAADAIYVKRTAPGESADGREGIRMAFRKLPTSVVSRHVMLNHVVTVRDADSADGFAVGLVVRGNRDRESWPMPIRGVELVLEYRMAFRREPDGWRIVKNDTQRIMDVETANSEAGTAR